MTRPAKTPRTPPGPLIRDEDEDIVWSRGPLWRIHRTAGEFVLAWDQLRAWGPAGNCRWEPHPPPAGEHQDEGVMYTSADFATAVVETFQATRKIDPHTGGPKGTSWSPLLPLRLLRLTDDWCLRNGASAALTMAPHSTCSGWARVIRQTWPDLDGLWSSSVLTGRPNITLWRPAADTFPTAGPAFSEYLADDLLWPKLDAIAMRYRRAGYRLI